MAGDAIPVRPGGVKENMSHMSSMHPVEELTTAIPPHPLGVKPLGNLYTATSNARPACGNFEQLPDEVLMAVFEFFEPEVLNLLSSTCRFLYAFSRCEDLWRALFIKYVHFSIAAYKFHLGSRHHSISHTVLDM